MNERGAITFGPIVGFFVVVLAIIGFFAVCTDGDGDIDTWAPVQVAGHEYDDGCWDGECYSYDERNGGSGDGRGGDGRYAGGRSGDMEQGDGRNCRNACDNTIIVPTPGDRGDDENRR